MGDEWIKGDDEWLFIVELEDRVVCCLYYVFIYCCLCWWVFLYVLSVGLLLLEKMVGLFEVEILGGGVLVCVYVCLFVLLNGVFGSVGKICLFVMVYWGYF